MKKRTIFKENKKYVYEWQNKFITNRAKSIDDFIAIFNDLTERLKRWKKKGVEIDPDIIFSSDDYVRFAIYDEAFALKEGFKEDTFEEDMENFEGRCFQDWDDPLDYQEISFPINRYLSVKMIGDKTQIFVNNKPFDHCKYLLLDIPVDEADEYDEIDSIDEAKVRLGGYMEYDHSIIPPRTEFWGHCSNLQAWAENDYDTRLLHSNLAFPLLRKLTQAGDKKARKVYKEEIGIRFVSGFLPVIQFLFRGDYLEELTREEFVSLLDEIDYTKLDFDDLLKRLNYIEETEYGYLLLSRVREEFLTTFSQERRYVELMTHHLDRSEYCPVVITHDRLHFIRGSNDGKLKEFDIIKGDLLRSFGNHSEYVKTLAISPNGKMLASSSGKMVKLWDYESGILLHSFEGHDDYISSLVFQPDSRYLLSGADGADQGDCSIKVWDLKKKELVATLGSHWRMINSLSFSHNGKYMVSSADDKTVNVWDGERGSLLTTLVGHSDSVIQAVVTNEKKVVSASSDNTIKIWDVDSGKVLNQIDILESGLKLGPESSIASCVITPDSKFIIATFQTPKEEKMGYLTVWRFSDGKLVQKLPIVQDYIFEELRLLTISIDGVFVIATAQNTIVKLWVEFLEYMEFLDRIHTGKV